MTDNFDSSGSGGEETLPPMPAPAAQQQAKPRGGVGKQPTAEKEVKRPHGKTMPFKHTGEAELLWGEILQFLAETNRHPSDVVIHVNRADSGAPKVGMGALEGFDVAGDEHHDPVSAIKDRVVDSFHLGSGLNRPATYELYFVWKNGGGLLTRGTMRLDDPRMIQNVRLSQARIGAGAPPMVPPPQPQYHQQPQQQQPQYQQPQQTYGYPQPGGFGQPQQQQPTSLSPEMKMLFDRMERQDREMQRLYGLLMEPRREMRQQPQQPQGLGDLAQMGQAMEQMMTMFDRMRTSLGLPPMMMPMAAPVAPPPDATQVVAQATDQFGAMRNAVTLFRDMKKMVMETERMFGLGAPSQAAAAAKEEEEKKSAFEFEFHEFETEDGDGVRIPFVRETGELPLNMKGLAGFAMANPSIVETVMKYTGKTAEKIINKVMADAAEEGGAEEEQAEELEEKEEEARPLHPHSHAPNGASKPAVSDPFDDL